MIDPFNVRHERYPRKCKNMHVFLYRYRIKKSCHTVRILRYQILSTPQMPVLTVCILSPARPPIPAIISLYCVHLIKADLEYKTCSCSVRSQ